MINLDNTTQEPSDVNGAKKKKKNRKKKKGLLGMLGIGGGEEVKDHVDDPDYNDDMNENNDSLYVENYNDENPYSDDDNEVPDTANTDERKPITSLLSDDDDDLLSSDIPPNEDEGADTTDIIEALATEIMLQHEIPNISLESFGDITAAYEPSTLAVSTFGKHRFIGKPLTDKEKIYLFLQIEQLVENARKESKDKVTLNATQQVTYDGIIYRALILSDELLEDYMNAYNRTIMTNGEVASLTELAVIITV